MEVTFKDTQTEEKLRQEIRREIINEIRQTCGNCPRLKEFEQTIYKRMPQKVRGVYWNR